MAKRAFSADIQVSADGVFNGDAVLVRALPAGAKVRVSGQIVRDGSGHRIRLYADPGERLKLGTVSIQPGGNP